MVRHTLLLMAVAGLALFQSPAGAATRLKNICRVKGQESNTLQGLGIVVGLRGTGDGASFVPTIRGLARAMDLLGNHISDAAELKDTRNVALVMVTATVPAAGARQGDQIDCVVSSIGAAKSLVGGRLFMTPLQGPVPSIDAAHTRIFAFAEGGLHLDDPGIPTVARIHRGCRLEEDFFNVFTKNETITLVLDQFHADFEVSQEVADLVNSQMGIQAGEITLARALDATNIEVKIPQQYRTEPVLFVSQVLSLALADPPTDDRVVINQRAGSVVIGGGVEIGPVVVSHRNIVIETGDTLPVDRWLPIDPQKTQTTRLQALVEALNAVKVPTDDIIEIIKGLDRNGKLYGRLIVE